MMASKKLIGYVALMFPFGIIAWYWIIRIIMGLLQ